MDTLLTGMVDWKERKVFMNGVEMEIDDLGGFSVNVSTILAVEERMPSVERYIIWLEQHLTFEQVKRWCVFIGDARSITISDASDIIGTDKRTAKEILTEGIVCQVLNKGYNSTWKMRDKITRERMAKEAKAMQEKHVPKRGVDEVFKEERERMRKLEEPEEAIVETTVEDDDEPAKIVVGMKGVAVQPKRKVIQASQFAKAPVSEGVILPRKKPLETVSQGAKKSRKSAKG